MLSPALLVSALGNQVSADRNESLTPQAIR